MTATRATTATVADICADGFSGYPDCVLSVEDGDAEIEEDGDLEEDLEGSDGDEEGLTPGFVPIPAGSFWMGSPDGTCPEGYPGSCTSELGRNSNEMLHYVTLTLRFRIEPV